MTKRPTIKGKGADFFLKQEEVRYVEQRKVTFYIPETLVDALESVWLDLRKTHKKLIRTHVMLAGDGESGDSALIVVRISDCLK